MKSHVHVHLNASLDVMKKTSVSARSAVSAAVINMAIANAQIIVSMAVTITVFVYARMGVSTGAMKRMENVFAPKTAPMDVTRWGNVCVNWTASAVAMVQENVFVPIGAQMDVTRWGSANARSCAQTDVMRRGSARVQMFA